jgi:hypothetical protein
MLPCYRSLYFLALSDFNHRLSWSLSQSGRLGVGLPVSDVFVGFGFSSAGGNCTRFLSYHQLSYGFSKIGSQVTRQSALSSIFCCGVRRSWTFVLSGRPASQLSHAATGGEIAGILEPGGSCPCFHVGSTIAGFCGTITSGPRSPTSTGWPFGAGPPSAAAHKIDRVVLKCRSETRGRSWPESRRRCTQPAPWRCPSY